MKRLIRASVEPVNMIIELVSGLNSDGFKIIIPSRGVSDSFNYGYNASYDKSHARQAQQDYDNAHKHNWESKSRYSLKPYVSDIINDYCSKYGVSADNIEVTEGNSAFDGKSTAGADDFRSTYLSASVDKSVYTASDYLEDGLFRNYSEAEVARRILSAGIDKDQAIDDMYAYSRERLKYNDSYEASFAQNVASILLK